MPCGFLVLAVLPNYPNKGKRWWLTDAEFELAQARMQRVNRVQSDGLVNLTVLKRIFSNWRRSHFIQAQYSAAHSSDVYLLPLAYVFYGLGCASSSYYAIWLSECTSSPLCAQLWAKC